MRPRYIGERAAGKSRARRINRHLTVWRKEVAALSSKTPAPLLDLLAGNPFVTLTKVAKDLGVAYTTAQRAVQALEKLGIAKEVSQAKRKPMDDYDSSVMDRIEKAKPPEEKSA